MKKYVSSIITLCIAALMCLSLIPVGMLAASAQPVLDPDWTYIGTQSSPDASYFGQDAQTGALCFNSTTTEQLVLNNQTLFPAETTKQGFKLEFDVNFTGSYLAFSFVGNNPGNLMDGYVTVCFIDSWTFIKTENIGGASDILIGENNSMLRPNINGAGEKHVVIELQDGKLTVTVGGEVYWDAYQLPENWIGTGHMGMFVQGSTQGYVKNLTLTAGGQSKTYFAAPLQSEETTTEPEPTTEPETTAPETTEPEQTTQPGEDSGEYDDPSSIDEINYHNMEGWTLVGKGDLAYKKEGSDVLYFDYMDMDYAGPSGGMLVINSEVLGENTENFVNFNPSYMADYIIEFDLCIEDVDRGSVFLSLISDNKDHLANNGVGITFNDSCSALKYEVPAVTNYGTPAGSNTFGCIYGNGVYHIVVRKSYSQNDTTVVDVIMNDEVVVDGFEFPTHVPGDHGNNGEWRIPDTGYVGFCFSGVKGYLANVTVTNFYSNYTKTFFSSELPFEGELQWEQAGNTDPALAITVERGQYVHGYNNGAYPETASASVFKNGLDMSNFCFVFRPQQIITAEADANAYMSFALLNAKGYTEDPEAAQGLLAKIVAKDDGTAELTLLSMLKGEALGAHSTTIALESFEAGTSYFMSFKQTAEGTDVFFEDEKIAVLDWLNADVYEGNVGYFAYAASNSVGQMQEWVIQDLNYEYAVNYMGNADEAGKDNKPEQTTTETETEPEVTTNNETTEETTEPEPKKGCKSVIGAGAVVIAALAAFAFCKKKKEN